MRTGQNDHCARTSHGQVDDILFAASTYWKVVRIGKELVPKTGVALRLGLVFREGKIKPKAYLRRECLVRLDDACCLFRVSGLGRWVSVEGAVGGGEVGL